MAYPHRPTRTRLVPALLIILLGWVPVLAAAQPREPQRLRIATAAHASQVSRSGVTWIFNDKYEVGQFVNGDWWVVGPVRIIGITPGVRVVSGRTMNGSMINPTYAGKSHGNEHGFDSWNSGYKSSLNAGLGISASSALVLQPGQSLVSAISRENMSGLDTHADPFLDRVAVLTCLQSAPPADAFRPTYMAGEKRIHRASNIQWSLLPSLSPTPNAVPLKTATAWFENTWFEYGADASAHRFHPVGAQMPSYGRDMNARLGDGVLVLMLNHSLEQKRPLLISIIQMGIDWYGVAQNALANNFGRRVWEPDGGHRAGRKFPIVFAGFMLNDSAMKNIGYGGAGAALYFQEDAQTFYVTQKEVDITNSSQWSPSASSQKYTTAHIGMAEWGIRHATNPYADNSHWNASYRTCCNACSWVGWILMARAVPGMKKAWNHDALFDFQDRYMANEGGQWNYEGNHIDSRGYNILGKPQLRAWTRFAEEMWDTYRTRY